MDPQRAVRHHWSQRLAALQVEAAGGVRRPQDQIGGEQQRRSVRQDPVRQLLGHSQPCPVSAGADRTHLDRSAWRDGGQTVRVGQLGGLDDLVAGSHTPPAQLEGHRDVGQLHLPHLDPHQPGGPVRAVPPPPHLVCLPVGGRGVRELAQVHRVYPTPVGVDGVSGGHDRPRAQQPEPRRVRRVLRRAPAVGVGRVEPEQVPEPGRQVVPVAHGLLIRLAVPLI
jgi:hypothetical protein